MSVSVRLASVLGLSLAACGAPSDFPTATERTAIAGGELSGEADNAVVQIQMTAPMPYVGRVCTGTLVAPNLVLTALHCVAPSVAKPFRCESDGSLSPPDDGSGWLAEPVPPSDVAAYFGPSAAQMEPAAYGMEIFGSGSTELCIDDIALVALDRDLPAPPAALRLERDVSLGETLTVMGYGEGPPTPGPFVRARRDGVRVLGVGPDDTTQGTGVITPRMFVTDDGPCAGDEGGPAFAADSGAVVGVYSRGTVADACEEAGQRHLFVKVAPYAALVRRAFVAVGATPVEEREPAGTSSGQAAGCTVSTGARPNGAIGALFAAAMLARWGHGRRRRAVR